VPTVLDVVQQLGKMPDRLVALMSGRMVFSLLKYYLSYFTQTIRTSKGIRPGDCMYTLEILIEVETIPW